jgi:hypothetical protein
MSEDLGGRFRKELKIRGCKVGQHDSLRERDAGKSVQDRSLRRPVTPARIALPAASLAGLGEVFESLPESLPCVGTVELAENGYRPTRVAVSPPRSKCESDVTAALP